MACAEFSPWASADTRTPARPSPDYGWFVSASQLSIGAGLEGWTNAEGCTKWNTKIWLHPPCLTRSWALRSGNRGRSAGAAPRFWSVTRCFSLLSLRWSCRGGAPLAPLPRRYPRTGALRQTAVQRHSSPPAAGSIPLEKNVTIALVGQPDARAAQGTHYGLEHVCDSALPTAPPRLCDTHHRPLQYSPAAPLPSSVIPTHALPPPHRALSPASTPPHTAERHGGARTLNPKS